MKKKTIIASSLAVLVSGLIIVTLLILSGSAPIKYRFYSGDRITGTFIMTVNGVDYNPDEEFLEYENTGTQRLHTDDSGFSIKGGRYGSYKIGFLLDNKELYRLTGDELFEAYASNQTLTYQYINTNWWHVTEMSLTAEMVLINGEWIVKTKIVYSEPLESGVISEYTVKKTFAYNEMMQGNGIVRFGI